MIAGRRNAVVAAAGAAAALGPAIALRDFTVDDALITARYAAHLARGLGYRFNVAGAVTDGVTPLGFPYLLAPFAGGGPLAALAAAKVMGLASWTIAAAVLALAVDRAARAPGEHQGERRPVLGHAALLLVACSAPLSAWSVAGMETGLAAALAALAVALPELGVSWAGAVCAGLVAWLRPEALPFAIVLAASPSPGREETVRARAARVALAMAPFFTVMALRLAIFGRPVPLSVLAKPSGAALGANYAVVCFLLTGPIALLAPIAWVRLSGWGRGLVLAVLVHFAAIAAAGGDWMPLSRLAVPALPAAVLAFAHLARVASRASTAARLTLALAGEIFQLVKVGPSAARVGAARRAVIEELRAPLADAKIVAALDIGWLGAATGATIVDLAGLTDPDIAALPGGHTSKAIPRGLLDARRVDTIVLLVKEGEPVVVPWSDTFFARIVELRVAGTPDIADAFTLRATSGVPHLRYVVVRRAVP